MNQQFSLLSKFVESLRETLSTKSKVQILQNNPILTKALWSIYSREDSDLPPELHMLSNRRELKNLRARYPEH